MSIETQSLTIHRYRYYTGSYKTSSTQTNLEFYFVCARNAISKLVSPLPQAQQKLCYRKVVVSRLAAMPIVYVGKANVT